MDESPAYKEEFEKTLRSFRRTKLLFIITISIIIGFVIVMLLWIALSSPVEEPFALWTSAARTIPTGHTIHAGHLIPIDTRITFTV